MFCKKTGVLVVHIKNALTTRVTGIPEVKEQYEGGVKSYDI
jgi:hypothetical protein